MEDKPKIKYIKPTIADLYTLFLIAMVPDIHPAYARKLAEKRYGEVN